ncbi:MAG: DDE-type integrase/transposase/recombinase [Candidatus Micrarchaeota archaeon]
MARVGESGKFSVGVIISRQSINNVLKRHRMNGSPYGKLHEWKFFRAAKANEMWQIDLKGPVHMYGKRNFILVVIDDYSRCLIILKVYDKDPTTEDIVADLEKAFAMHGKPEKILSDNGGQFKDSWKEALLANVIEAVFAHPYYPRDKGKVERCIRNVNEEVIRLVKHLGLSLEDVVAQFKDWYNYKRYHQGVKDFPGLLYLKSISTAG